MDSELISADTEITKVAGWILNTGDILREVTSPARFTALQQNRLFNVLRCVPYKRHSKYP